MFFTGTVRLYRRSFRSSSDVMHVAPEVINAPPTEEIWRGMSTIAGSWIGGLQIKKQKKFLARGIIFQNGRVDDYNLWLALLMLG